MFLAVETLPPQLFASPARKPTTWAEDVNKAEGLERWAAECLAHSRCSVKSCEVKPGIQLWSFLCDLREGVE